MDFYQSLDSHTQSHSRVVSPTCFFPIHNSRNLQKQNHVESFPLHVKYFFESDFPKFAGTCAGWKRERWRENVSGWTIESKNVSNAKYFVTIIIHNSGISSTFSLPSPPVRGCCFSTVQQGNGKMERAAEHKTSMQLMLKWNFSIYDAPKLQMQFSSLISFPAVDGAVPLCFFSCVWFEEGIHLVFYMKIAFPLSTSLTSKYFTTFSIKTVILYICSQSSVLWAEMNLWIIMCLHRICWCTSTTISQRNLTDCTFRLNSTSISRTAHSYCRKNILFPFKSSIF